MNINQSVKEVKKHKWPSNREYICQWLINAGIGFIFVFLFSYSTSPLYGRLVSDQAMFALVGRGITEGIIPYKDLLENKGPLFFLLEAFPQFFHKGTVGILVFQGFLLTLECAGIDFIARTFRFHKKYAGMLKGIFLFLLMLLYSEGNMAEEYDTFCLLMGFLLMLFCRYTEKEKPYQWCSFFMGALTMSVLMIKMSDAVGLCAIDVIYMINIISVTYKKKGWIRKTFQNIMIAILGGMAVLIPACAYYWYHGALTDMIYGYLTLNFSMVNEGGKYRALVSRIGLFFNWYGLLAAIPIVIICFCLIQKYKDKTRELYICLLTVAVFIMLGTYVHATGFRQHLMPVAVSWVAAGIGVGNCTGLGKKPHYNILTVLLSCGVIAYIAIFLNYRMQTNNINRYLNINYAIGIEKKQDVFISEIPQEDYDSVYGIDIDCGWYYRNHIFPAYKWLNLDSFISHMGQGIAEDFERELMERPVKWLMVNDKLEKYEETLTNHTIRFITENYEIVSEQEGMYLYRYRNSEIPGGEKDAV